MSLGFLPELVSEFDLETELAALLNDVPTLSAGQWTDTSATDPAVVLLRKALEAQQGLLYQSSVRYLPDYTTLHLARLKGLSPNPASPARTVCLFTVAANTTIQAGLLVASEFTGLEYEILSTATFVAAGNYELEVRCTTSGFEGNTGGEPLPPVGAIRTPRSAPTAGQILAVRDIQPATGGRAAETLEEFALRLPDLIRDETLHMPSEFLSEIYTFPAIKKAAVWRAKKPIAIGVFAHSPGQTTVVLMAAGGAAPGNTVITDVRQRLYDKSYFNNLGTNAEEAGIYVVGVRSRAVGVACTVYVSNQTDRTAFKAIAEARISAFLNPETGGDDGLGWELGIEPTEDAIIALLRNDFRKSGLTRVDNDTVVISNSGALAIDEVISAGTMNLTVLYG